MSIQESIKIVPRGDIALVEWDLIGEKVNKLSSPVMKRFDEVLDQVKNNPAFKAVVFISRKPKIFIAGADIEEIRGIKKKEDAGKVLEAGHKIINKLEDLPIPVIAAINGACLGGGLEVALACDYRIASDDPSTKLGLPEVNLGVIPGFGGCVRLPRVIGVQAALDIILAGKAVDGKKAEKLGLADKCVPSMLLEASALEFARDVVAKGAKKRRRIFKPKGFMNVVLEGVGRPIVFSQAKKMVLSKSKGHYPAPLKALDVIQKTVGVSDRARALEVEAKGFADVVVTDVSKNLIHIFFMTEAIKRQTGVANPNVKPKEIKRLGVLGAGTMGGGIAQLAADKGIEVRVKDINNEALAKAYQTARSIWEKSLKRRKLNQFDFNRKMALISGGTSFDGFGQLDIVVEAIVEDMGIKQKVIGETAKHCKDACIIATNTSSLSVSEMAKGHPRPEKFGGMHFFNPVNKMPLIEVIRGEKTDDETTATIFELSKKLGKFPVVVKDGPGFLVNRLLLPYLNEAVYMVAEGVSVEAIDAAYLKFGMPMGPLHLIDEIGIDVAVKVAKIFHKSFGERAEPSPTMMKLAENKERLGKKSKKGFYLYDEKEKKLNVDPTVFTELGVKPGSVTLSDEEIVKRGVFAMVNEAALALIEDRIVETASEVDLAMIMGTGFPPFRGGLLKYADAVGSDVICDELEVFATKIGKRFKPSTPLRNMAKTKRQFYATGGGNAVQRNPEAVP